VKAKLKIRVPMGGFIVKAPTNCNDFFCSILLSFISFLKDWVGAVKVEAPHSGDYVGREASIRGEWEAF